MSRFIHFRAFPWQRPFSWKPVTIVILAVVALIGGYVGLSFQKPPHRVSGPRFPSTFRPLMLTSGAPASIVKGRHMTIVMLMASWCLYCAYEDKYVWARVTRSLPGVEINIVDVSSHGGIADPGPQFPPFSGHDNRGSLRSLAGIRQTMTAYRQRLGLDHPHIHIFVDPAGIKYWHVTSFPTLLFVNSAGQLVHRVNGALTDKQMTTLITSLEHSQQ